MLRCAAHYVFGERFSRVHSDERTWFAEAKMWVRSVCDLADALYQLPAHLVEIVRSSARDQGFRLPQSLDLQDQRTLVDAVETIIGLEHALDSGAWSRISGLSLSRSESEKAVELAIELARTRGSRSGADIAFRMLSHGFNRRACDGRELELSEFGIIHVPEPDSPQRSVTRDRMLRLLEHHFTHQKHPGLPERLPGESSTEWAARVVNGWNAIPEDLRAARHAAQKHVEAAAHILVAIGDERSVGAIWKWLENGNEQSLRLFNDSLFGAYAYEIVPPGKRKNLHLVGAHFLKESPLPTSPARREVVEVFRPIEGACQTCGSRLLAFFDLLPTRLNVVGLPVAGRVVVPFCPECCEHRGGIFESIRMFDANEPDVDAWPVEQAKALPSKLPARCFTAQLTRPGIADVGGWLGGLPRWEQYPEWTQCDRCCNKMRFAGQIWYSHSYYAFICPDCLRCNVRTQYD